MSIEGEGDISRPVDQQKERIENKTSWQLTELKKEVESGRPTRGSLKDFFKKNSTEQLAAISNVDSNAAIQVGDTVKIDFHGNRTLEMEITAGHILPPEISEITVNTPDRGELTGKRRGLKGEFYSSGGERLKIYSDTIITIKSVRDTIEVQSLKNTVDVGSEKFPVNNRNVAKIALERGIDPNFLLKFRGANGTFQNLFKNNPEYLNLSSEEQTKMAATVIGRSEGQFASRFPDLQVRDEKGSYTPEFVEYCIFTYLNGKNDANNSIRKEVFQDNASSKRAKLFRKKLSEGIDDRGAIDIKDMNAYLEYLQRSPKLNDRIKAGIARYGKAVCEEASKYPNLRQRIPYIFAQIEGESMWNPKAHNNKGENSYGLLQINLVEKTGHLKKSRAMKLDIENNPIDNLKYGIWYLNGRIDKQGGSYKNGLDLYNGGGNFSRDPKARYSAGIFGLANKYMPQ